MCSDNFLFDYTLTRKYNTWKRTEDLKRFFFKHMLIGSELLSTTYYIWDETCSTDIDDCEDGSCQNNGRCIDRLNGFECDCNGTGYQGLHCTDDINECELGLCVHGTCNNSHGSFLCSCYSGSGFFHYSTCYSVPQFFNFCNYWHPLMHLPSGDSMEKWYYYNSFPARNAP